MITLSIESILIIVLIAFILGIMVGVSMARPRSL